MPASHLTHSREDDVSAARRDDPRGTIQQQKSAYAVGPRLSLHLIDPSRVTESVMTVRDHNGDLLVTDGPFAETKEQMLG